MGNRIPYPSVGFPKQVRAAMEEETLAIQTLAYSYSGEVTSEEVGVPLGVVAKAGQLSDFVVAVQEGGRDDNDDLIASLDLKVNGASVLDSAITLTGLSGEDAGALVGATPSFSSTSVSRGDLITLDMSLTRTTPDTEMNNLAAAVKIVPVGS